MSNNKRNIKEDVKSNFCEFCNYFDVCPLNKNDNLLKTHIMSNADGGYTCDKFSPIIFQFNEESFSSAQKKIIKDAHLEFNKDYMLLEIKDVILQLSNSCSLSSPSMSANDKDEDITLNLVPIS